MLENSLYDDVFGTGYTFTSRGGGTNAMSVFINSLWDDVVGAGDTSESRKRKTHAILLFDAFVWSDARCGGGVNRAASSRDIFIISSSRR